MKDLLTIHEFARITGEEVSKLRFYDKIGVFTPINRNPENNYRYYSLTQIPTLNFIVILADLNVPLKTIAELRQKRTPSELLKLLEKQEKIMDMEMRKLRERYSIIHARRELINYGTIVAKGFKAVKGVRIADGEPSDGSIDVNENVVSILYREDKDVHLWPRNEYRDGDTFVQPLAAFIGQAAKRHINLNFPVGGYWESMGSFLKEPSRPERFFTIDPIGDTVRKEGHYVIGFNRGKYGDMGDLPQRMDAFSKEKGLVLSGPVWVMYMFDEVCTHDPSQYMVQACVAVSKPRKRKAVPGNK